MLHICKNAQINSFLTPILSTERTTQHSQSVSLERRKQS